ncbi:MAG: N-formylglutamate amidohydrolase [Gammaproteobacteria bacterium]|nr:N-formylglutamate amidohydrolase [Gammaproteobacteria bacterium]
MFIESCRPVWLRGDYLSKQSFVTITCEHGGNDIPDIYRPLFLHANDLLSSHRGLDLGALSVFMALKEANIANFYHHTTISRLFVELNRSLGHPRLWSEFTQNLSIDIKDQILASYYFPYRSLVESTIKDGIHKMGRVIHLSIHSFTAQLNGEQRKAEVGFLYDPSRFEKPFCDAWRVQMQALKPTWRIRRNYPYRGTADGLITYLRKKFSASEYLGIELEMNQELLRSDKDVGKIIVQSLKKTLAMNWLPEQD